MILSMSLLPYRFGNKAKAMWIMLFAFLFHHMAWGAVSLNMTRVIIDHDDREANVRVLNEAQYPVLIQGWIDAGDVHVPLEKIRVPFVITSPMFRLEPGAAQQLRILFTGTQDALPEDRESVFWLNVQEIPPNLFVEKGENHMQIAFRTRIKLFYRPVSIPQNTESLHEQLVFKIVQENNRPVLQIDNPTAIHVSLLEIIIGSTEEPLIQIAPKEGMVAPFGILKLPLTQIGDKHEANTPVTYLFINDFGVSVEKQTQLTTSP